MSEQKTENRKQGGLRTVLCSLFPVLGRADRGFTLVEMIVAVALFAVVMLVSVGALLALVGANRKAQALQSVMNNLNIALDGMVRSVRMGSEYHCGAGNITTPQSCEESGDTLFAFKSFCTGVCDPLNRWVYVFDTNGSYCGAGRLCKSENNGTNYYAVTSPDVTIDSMKFFVIGTLRGDATQPKVVIEVKGTAGANQVKTRTTFNIQATAVQRILDL
jgi:prepilin-type N-terminal cleavage/methylation domain-containing protein